MSSLTSIIPEMPIDVVNWREDEEWSSYPEGARPKSAHFPPVGELPNFINPARRYLLKRSVDRYPDQFWMEIVAYHIGCLLQVDVPPAYPAINSGRGYCGALIEWFYEDGLTSFVAGGDYMQKSIPSFDRKKGEQHNFHTVRVVFRALQREGRMASEWAPTWVRTLLLDSLCGNTDRHQDNWGVLFDQDGAQQNARLCPAFDNGTSLGHELSENHHGRWGNAEIAKYVRRGRHHMKWDKEEIIKVNHFEFMTEIAKLWPWSKDMMRTRLERFDVAALRDCMDRLAALEMPIAMSAWRIGITCKLIEKRRDMLLEALQ